MKKIFILLNIITIFFILFITYCYFVNKEKNELIKGASILIQKVDSYKLLKKRLPESVTELGIEEQMDIGTYYQKLDSNRYIIYYNIGFDDSFVYYSNLKEWRHNP